jgi:membrane protein implicated in regulation of membrane protease activity
VKEFWVYTGLRLLFFAASVVVVGGIWLAVNDSANLMWVLVISLVISGLASLFLLRRQRTALARHVDDRARRATEKFEELKAKEDVD